jgi:hypothetical protein
MLVTAVSMFRVFVLIVTLLSDGIFVIVEIDKVNVAMSMIEDKSPIKVEIILDTS